MSVREPLTYKQCIKRWASRGRSDSVRMANNTLLLREYDGSFALRFHATVIIRVAADDVQRLYTRGYNTVTTKNRLNRFSYVQVHQRKNEWFAGGQPFFDDMIVTPTGPAPQRFFVSCGTYDDEFDTLEQLAAVVHKLQQARAINIKCSAGQAGNTSRRHLCESESKLLLREILFLQSEGT